MRVKKTKGRIFAIGDIHGCCLEAKTLVDYIIEVEKLTQQFVYLFLNGILLDVY